MTTLTFWVDDERRAIIEPSPLDFSRPLKNGDWLRANHDFTDRSGLRGSLPPFSTDT